MAAFTYMGTKKSLASTISAVCEDHGPGPFLDLFSGISAAGTAIAPKRQIWCNDVQIFSRTLTEALFLSRENIPRKEIIARTVQRLGRDCRKALLAEVRKQVEQEVQVLGNGTKREQIALQKRLAKITRCSRHDMESVHTHCLFTSRYSGTYFGLIQSIELDAIRYGTDLALRRSLISIEEHRWALLAICRSIAAISNSTGHFAQYLTPSASNINRVLGKRRRSAWAYWLGALEDMSPIGDPRWRMSNRVFHGDAIDVLHEISGLKNSPGVIYADPPYTSDQYSRYYHLFETAILYDYPSTQGKGLYREGRYRSSFSLSREVESSFIKMISAAAEAGGSLIISYPSAGLLTNSLRRIPEIMRESFRQVFEPIIIPHKHSTLGASKGPGKEEVEECIFVASQTRV